MSASIRTAFREVVETLRPGKSKQQPPPVVQPKALDPEAVNIGSQAVQLHREATGAGITLDGKLSERRDAINDTALAGDPKAARLLLDSFRNDVNASVELRRDVTAMSTRAVQGGIVASGTLAGHYDAAMDAAIKGKIDTGKQELASFRTGVEAAIGIRGQAATLFSEAVKSGVTLNGKLVERRDAIIASAAKGEADPARGLLTSFRTDVDESVALAEEAALHVDPPGITAAETEHARQLRLSVKEDIDSLKLNEAADAIEQLAVVTSRSRMRADLGLDRMAGFVRSEIEVELPDGTSAAEKKEVAALQALALKQLEGDLTAEKIEKARELARPVANAIGAIERRLEVVDGADPGLLYERLRLRKNDVVNYPAEYRSPAVTTLCNRVSAADMDAQLKLSVFTRAAQGKARDAAAEEATTAIGALREKIEAAAPGVREHDAAVRSFFALLKKMMPQIAVADGLPTAAADGSDTAWKTEREAYDASRTKVVALQNEKKFREANAELGECAKLMKALLDKRRAGIDGDIAAAAAGGPSRAAVTKLETDGLLAILTPEQQLGLLRKLPAGNANNPTRYKILGNPAMDATFVAEEGNVLKDVVKMLRGDDGPSATPESRQAKQDWQSYEENWAAWAGKDPKRVGDKDLPKLEGIFTKIALAQFKKLMVLAGLDWDNTPPGFPKPPVSVVLKTMPLTEFGGASPDFPSIIEINSAHSQFGDFKEMIDTILHENAHAWQNMVVAQYKGTGPFRPEDTEKVKGATALPAMKVQAELFAQNDDSYTNTGDAYRHEPLEEQAWTFGGKSSTALLVPPPARSMDSSKGLKNKFWAVASLGRTPNAAIRLRERHGIYVSEWEGERAADKKLTLEGVAGLSPSQRLVVRDVIDEYTLALDLNASALRGRVVPTVEVEAEMQAIANGRHPGKKLKELTEVERKQLRDDVVAAKNWELTGSDGDQTAVVRGKTEVDVEHARLVLDESVAKLS